MLWACLVLLAWGGFSGTAQAQAGQPDAARPVPTLVVQSAAAAGWQQLEGVLQPLRQATLAAQTQGSVLALAVKPGDRVRAGQVLARVDAREAQAAVQHSQAGVAQAEAQLRQAQLSAQRNQALRQQGFISQAALDQTDTQVQAAQAGLAQARAGQQQAALAQGFSSVQAPFDAVVLATHLEPGDLASAGRPIATLYAPGALRAVVQVPASRLASVRQAGSVQVLVLADDKAQLGDPVDGTPLRRLVPVARQLLPGADAVSQTTEWRLELPAAEAALLRPGQAVQVQWRAAADAAAGSAAASGPPTLPSAAVLRRGELSAVYVVQASAAGAAPRFVLRAVRLGPQRGTGAAALSEVLAGLKPGERVAADAVAAGLTGAVPAL